MSRKGTSCRSVDFFDPGLQNEPNDTTVLLQSLRGISTSFADVLKGTPVIQLIYFNILIKTCFSFEYHENSKKWILLINEGPFKNQQVRLDLIFASWLLSDLCYLASCPRHRSVPLATAFSDNNNKCITPIKSRPLCPPSWPFADLDGYKKRQIQQLPQLRN